MTTWGVLQFPGSCDERDALAACSRLGEARMIWHEERGLGGVDAVVVPGGFSYGDYLRAGAIARFSPAMEAVAEHAAGGGAVLGICNGFQVLCEAGLLPGALLLNEDLRFVCRQVDLIPGPSATSSPAERGRVALGCRFPSSTAKGGSGRPRRCSRSSRRTGRSHTATRRARIRTGRPATSPGSATRRGNVVGLMPHPEHAVDALTGSTDGLRVFEGMI